MFNKYITAIILLGLLIVTCDYPTEFTRDNPIDSKGEIFFTTNLKDSSYVKGIILIRVSDMANGEIFKVDFLIDGNIIAADIGYPFQISWDTHLEDDGEHIVSYIAYNQDNDFKRSNTKIIIDNTPPILELNSQFSDTVTTSLAISVDGNAYDAIQIDKTEFYINDVCLDTQYSSSFNFTIEDEVFLGLPFGYNLIKIITYDVLQNTDTSMFILHIPYELGEILFCKGSCVCIMTSMGDHITEIVRNINGYNTCACWSPSNDKICYTSGGPNFFELYVINIDGTNKIQLTHNGLGNFEPSWSPDGTRIAYHTYHADLGKYQIHIINADGTREQIISDSNNYDIYPSWSPNSQEVVFIRNHDQLIIKNLNDLSEREIIVEGRSDFNYTDWSLSTNRIIVETQANLYMIYPDGSDLFIIDVDGTPTSPSWSPDGSKIVFTATPITTGNIFVINSDGTNLYNIILNYLVNDPCWKR